MIFRTSGPGFSEARWIRSHVSKFCMSSVENQFSHVGSGMTLSFDDVLFELDLIVRGRRACLPI